MEPAYVEQVRRFNRTVTQRIGALNDDYLARHRSLGESRLLWEVGIDGCEVRVLRRRLDLDSGYASRLLRALEEAGLVRVTAGRTDSRVRMVTLTRKGIRERATLDARSDELAGAMLAPLTSGQQRRLVAAMADVERLLTVSLVVFDVIDPATGEAQHCLQEYYAELDRRFEEGFAVGLSRQPDLDEMRAPAGAFVVARLRDEAVGCGVLTRHGTSWAELKRIWVASSVRGLGLGRRILAELERLAAQGGARKVRLDTNRTLTEAIELYRSTGYREIPAFNDERYAHHWFEKRLPRPTHHRLSPRQPQ